MGTEGDKLELRGEPGPPEEARLSQPHGNPRHVAAFPTAVSRLPGRLQAAVWLKADCYKTSARRPRARGIASGFWAGEHVLLETSLHAEGPGRCHWTPVTSPYLQADFGFQSAQVPKPRRSKGNLTLMGRTQASSEFGVEFFVDNK